MTHTKPNSLSHSRIAYDLDRCTGRHGDDAKGLRLDREEGGMYIYPPKPIQSPISHRTIPSPRRPMTTNLSASPYVIWNDSILEGIISDNPKRGSLR